METGIEWLFGKLDDSLPGEIHYERVQASLGDPVIIEGFAYVDGPLRVDIQYFQLDVALGALFTGTARISTLRLDGVRATIPPSTDTVVAPNEPTSPFSLPQISLPLNIDIGLAEITDVSIDMPDRAAPVVVDRATLKARTDGNAIVFETFEFVAPTLQASLTGRVTPLDHYPMALDVAWSAQPVGLPAGNGKGRIDGSLADLTLTHASEGFLAGELDASVQNALEQPAWTLAADLRLADLGLFAPQYAGADAAFQAQSEGSLDDYQADIHLTTGELPDIGAVTADLLLAGDRSRVLLQPLSVTSTRELGLEATADVNLETRVVNAEGKWTALRWPLVGPPVVQAPRGAFAVKGTLNDYTYELDSQVLTADYGNYQVDADGHGSSEAIDVDTLAIRGDGDRALTLSGRYQLAEQSFSVKGDWTQWQWPLSGPPQVATPTGRLEAAGRIDQFEASLSAALADPAGNPMSAELVVERDGDIVLIEPLSLRADQGPLSLSARARVDLGAQHIESRGHWQDLRWPLTGEPRFSAPTGTFAVSATPDDVNVDLTTDIAGAQIPTGSWTLSGNGDGQGFDAVTLRGRTLEGEIVGEGRLAWAPAPRWDLSLQANDINPGVKYPQWPGAVTLAATSQGDLAAGTRIDAVISTLSGQLRGQPLSGGGSVSVNDQTIEVNGLSLGYGSAAITAEGVLADDYALDWTIAVPDLAPLVPAGRGRIEASGGVTGPRAAPRATVDLTARGLAIAGVSGEHLSARGDLSLGEDGESQLTIDGTDWVIGGQPWTRLDARYEGSLSQHTLRAGLDGELAAVALAFSGGVALDEATWRGRISELSLERTPAGDWRLAEAAALDAGAGGVRLEPLCLTSSPARLCSQADIDADGAGTARVELAEFDLARLAGELPDGSDIPNRLGLTMDARLPGGGGDPQVDAQARVSSGTVRVVVQGEPVDVPLDEAVITANLASDTLQAQMAVDADRFGRLDGEATVQGLTRGPGGLSGAVTGEVADLGVIGALIPEVTDLAGRLGIDLRLGGTMSTPTLAGGASVSDGRADVPRAGLELRQVSAEVRAQDGQQLLVDATAASGEGRVDIGGRYTLASGEGRIDIDGQRLTVMDTEEIRIIAEPELVVDISPELTRVSGTITVPEAFLSPPRSTRAGGVSPSSDVIVINDADEALPDPVPTSGLAVDVTVVLGDEVNVAAGGFEGRLLGSLNVIQTPTLPPRGRGTIEVASGEYVVYGQTLNLDRGRILFSGGPVENPGLDMQASRQIDDVIAGVRIRGSAREPRLELYSNPSMPDSSILSYLVLGRAPDARSGSESALLLRAAAALGGGQINDTVSPMGETLGLDTFSVETGGEDAASAALVVGKYLSPDLYVSYGVGLFDALNTFTLRYELTERLSLESQTTGEASGADLLYVIER